MGVSAVLVAGCGGSGGTSHAATKSTGAKSTAPAAPAARKLTFDLVKGVGETALGGDSACGYGEWNDGTFAIDKPYSKQTTFYREYSCYEKKGELFPNAAGQMSYAEFGSPAQATAYGNYTKTNISAVAVLVSDNAAVTVNIGYLTLNKMTLLKQVQQSCGGCGTVIAGPHASDPVPGHVDKS
ncbi:hypothetical protein [Actinomadura violacea]|uniref:Lipoprotein n=1 Tax=Actinomadura violacea TaxID=2819934 RepID=A0ABS3RZU3_9ACTN|nr:hypothetical protein [Actinomadura violacea]MBO2462267.1 hypothetical protein [Actinomadura violacea]